MRSQPQDGPGRVRTVSGYFSADGISTVLGAGYVLVKPAGSGSYQLYFRPRFRYLLSVTTMPRSSGFVTVTWNTTADLLSILTWGVNGSTLTDLGVAFTATGIAL